jgi:hypothetical protein
MTPQGSSIFELGACGVRMTRRQRGAPSGRTPPAEDELCRRRAFVCARSPALDIGNIAAGRER